MTIYVYIVIYVYVCAHLFLRTRNDGHWTRSIQVSSIKCTQISYGAKMMWCWIGATIRTTNITALSTTDLKRKMKGKKRKRTNEILIILLNVTQHPRNSFHYL